jgi:hypothetical protein
LGAEDEYLRDAGGSQRLFFLHLHVLAGIFTVQEYIMKQTLVY